MQVTLGIKNINWQKIGLLFSLLFMALLGSKILASGYYKYLLFLSFLAGFLILYLKQFELFILFVLIINEELFFLLPREIIGGRSFQDALYAIFLVTGGLYFIIKKRKQNEINFNWHVISLAFIVSVGILNSFLHGQPIILGLKAGKGYYLILFYFVFKAREINQEKLFKIIVAAGVLLALLNNIQYIFFFKGLKIFHFAAGEVQERAGTVRFLIGDFFTILSPLIALSEYLRTKTKLYLISFLYLLCIVFLQGKTRAVMWGISITIFLLLYYSKKMKLSRVIFLGIPILAIFIWLLPVIKSSFFGEIYETTKYEFSSRTGNVGIRFDAYEHYLGESTKSPLIGRGIWNYQHKDNNPEQMQERGLYLVDIGIAGFVFHFGLAGAIWLVMLFARIYKVSFLGIGQLKRNIPYVLVGYFAFSFFTMPTLNCLVETSTILYLALILALFSQLDLSDSRSAQG